MLPAFTDMLLAGFGVLCFGLPCCAGLIQAVGAEIRELISKLEGGRTLARFHMASRRAAVREPQGTGF